MYCKNCGEQLNENQAICVKCGVKVGVGNNFCANCGQPIAPNASVCMNCGVAVKNSIVNKDMFKNINLPNVNSDELKAKAKKFGPIIGGGIAGLIAIIIIISILINGTGYKGAAKKYLKAYVNKDAEAMVEMLPEYSYAIQEEYDDDFDREDFEDDYKDYWEDEFDDIEDYFDDKIDGTYKLTYEITKYKELSSNKVEDFVEHLEDWYKDVEIGNITKVVEVKGKIIAKSGKKTRKVTVEFTVFKEDRKWKAVRGHVSD